ncbi:MAG: hypothetical protein OEY69_09485 [Candidatus Krumholzibacteria bacterium]|nr:hypothetical protein [Candidatus Krumholzibacteria bacterium]
MFVFVLADPPVQGGRSDGRSGTPVVRADTMIATDCELILFGKDVLPVTRQGRRGYWISRDDTSVTCNGITCMTVSDYFPKVVITPEIERKTRLVRRAAERIWESRETNHGSVVIDEEVRGPAEVFQLSVPEEDAMVTIRLSENEMTIYTDVNDIATVYPLDRPQMLSQDALGERIVRSAYQSLVDAIVPNRLVVVGAGYRYSYPRAMAAEVRAALGEIPRAAELDYVDSLGRARYKPVKTRIATWNPTLVGEVMEGE